MQKNILLILFVAVCQLASAQKYSFVKYSTEEGLPQTQVSSICQDNRGYLWVGTLGGLAKFNGSEFTTYSSNDGLINNRITTLNFFNNILWVGHDGGISLVKPNEITHISFAGNDKSRKVSDIISFNDEVLVSADGGGLFRIKDSMLQRVDLPTLDSEVIRDAHVVGSTLYLATKDGVYRSEDAKEFKLWSALGAHSFSGISSGKDFLLLTSFNNGVFKYQIKNEALIKIEAEKLIHPVTGCYIDKNELIWLKSEQGIIRIDKRNNVSFLDDRNGLPVNMISCFYQDKEENMWVGSEGKGIFRFPGALFKYYDQSTGLPSDLFLGGFQKRNGDFLFATYDKGLIRQKPDGTINEIDIYNNTVWSSLEGVDKKDWFGTQASLVSVDHNANVETFDLDGVLPLSKVTALYKIDKNSMYIGGKGAAIYRSGKFERLGRENDEDIGFVRDFEVMNGEMYCVTNLGIFKYVDNSFKLLGDIQQVVYCIEKDKDNNLWFGTEEGLFKWSDGKKTRIDLLLDPASNFINFLNIKNGDLYVGTNNGLFIVSDLNATNPKIKRYGKGEGVVDVETNLNSGFFDRQGNFWFGTASGLICYHPNAENSEPSKPSLNLKSILLNYDRFDYAEYSEVLTVDGFPADLTLPNSKNNLIIDLDGVSLVHHDGLRYQFYLEGLNDVWSPLTEVPSITFTSLPAGTYKLRIRAVDIDGRMSDEYILPFTIREAFYKTWWFISLVVILIALIVIGVFRFRLKRINELNQKEKLEYKARLLALEQKSVNASMNRHFIFNALNSIQYFINTQDRLSANKYLTNFAQLIRKNLDSATADNNTITLEEELARIKLYLNLEAMRFKDKFDYKINIGEVDTESILIPSMIMQPFVENSIIHGILPNEDVIGEIVINVQPEGEFLNIVIEDNGIGVNKSMKQKAQMDGDHKSQGMEITSKRIELIQKISNLNISLEGPSEIVDHNGLIKGTRVLIKIPLENLDF